MAEYIEREAAMRAARHAWGEGLEPSQYIEIIPADDVAPVVRCRDCIYTRKLYGRLVCKYGTCSGCILREDFFCANDVTRKDGDSDAID